ncbi:uncharacterized protein L203_104808 [Cryptococcus depauperatus CBS 7841]|uniref:Uncharacterized protein n=1 Tax=Cryptococcus depauperatus CBS 7841 TaxID=1295531 RepID=A0A1E3INQ9_9TREE|nr:alpha 1,6-mannosyltransferase [Cryptococcus depauperatus CBS 7841]
MFSRSYRGQLWLQSPTSDRIAAFSRLHSPTVHSRSHSLLLTPSFSLESNYEDVEKASRWHPPNNTTNGHTSCLATHGLTPTRHLSLRRKRLLSQVLMALGVIGMLGWVVFIYRQLGGAISALNDKERPLDAPIPNLFSNVSGDPFLLAKLNGEDGTNAMLPTPVLRPAEEEIEEPLSGQSHVDEMVALADIFPQQWGLKLIPAHLTAGLVPWPSNPPINESQPALSALGYFADNIYNIGPRDMEEYRKHLKKFINAAWPRSMQPLLLKGLNHFTLPSFTGEKTGGQGDYDWDKEKYVWQTDKDMRHAESKEVASWKEGIATNEGWQWDLVTDKDANRWMKKYFSGSRIMDIWDNLPPGILRSDTLRYLLLLLRGGIYTDTDTVLLKPPSKWGQKPRLYKNGENWLTNEQKQRWQQGATIEEIIGRPSIIVGLEADVGERTDWYDWWPRPIQITQWTMASTPAHPIVLSTLLRILHSTATAVSWAHQTANVAKILKEQGRYKDAQNLTKVSVMNEPSKGGPLGVMSWTGPGVWTDATLEYLRVKYGLKWVDLKGIQEPLRIGDIVILPVTGFSPEVTNFGSKSRTDIQAMSEHLFAGSWKNE